MNEAIYNYKLTNESLYDSTELVLLSILHPEIALISNGSNNFKKTVSFDDIPHFIVENILTYVDLRCGNTVYPEAPAKVGHINRERKNISRYCGKLLCTPKSDKQNCSIHEHHTSNILLKPYGLWDLDPAALMPLNSLMLETLCPTSALKQQLNNLQ